MVTAALLAVACKPAAPAGAVPVAAPALPAEPAPNPEREPEPPTSALLHEGERIGWVESVDQLEMLGIEEDRTRVAIPFYISEGSRSRRVAAEVSQSGLKAGRFPEAATPLRVAVHHELVLRLGDGNPFAEVRCGEFDVLIEESERTRVRVRKRGVVLEGWVAGSVAPRGNADCPPRTIGIRPPVVTLRGQPPPEPEPLPDGFVEVHRVPIRRKGPIWRLLPGEAPTCDRWVWRRGGKRMEQRTSEGVHWYEVDVEAEGDAFSLLGPGFRSHDLNGVVGGMLCGQRLVVVAASDDMWTLVSTIEPVVAYHVDDVQRWYRSAEACEAAIEAELWDHAPGC